MIEHIIMPREKPVGCVIVLPGRGGSGTALAKEYKQFSGLTRTIFVGLTPTNLEWYPMPNGIHNQTAAVHGLEVAQKKVEAVTRHIRRTCRVHRENFALVGFSAGAVVSLHTAINSDWDYAGVVSHSGALLEPAKVKPFNDLHLQMMMIHCKDDCCFYWDERYVPTKTALKEGGYNVAFVEHEKGGHDMTKADFMMAGLFLAPLLGYPPTWNGLCCTL